MVRANGERQIRQIGAGGRGVVVVVVRQEAVGELDKGSSVVVVVEAKSRVSAWDSCAVLVVIVVRVVSGAGLGDGEFRCVVVESFGGLDAFGGGRANTLLRHSRH
jgi:hypothetical protein